VYQEGIQTIPEVVYVDTDGVIGKAMPFGKVLPTGWRIKTRMRTVDIAAAQALYYTCDECLPPPLGHDEGHWSVAGAASVQEKSRLFRLMKGGGMVVANINNVLPNQNMDGFGNAKGSEEANWREALALFDSAQPFPVQSEAG
jgi:hypothetical protein